ncbi:MAG: OmpA family protein [Bacteroidota bacterium]
MRRIFLFFFQKENLSGTIQTMIPAIHTTACLPPFFINILSLLQTKAMNKKFYLLLLVLIPAITQAQFGKLLNKVKDKANSKATQRLDAKIDKAIDQGLDKAEGKGGSAGATEANSGGSSSTEAEEKQQEPAGVNAFSKYDFIPGNEIVYYDNFEQDAMAELPTGWNTNGSGEVVTLDKFAGNWLRIHKNFVYLTANEKAFSENFTAEFDVVMQLKNNGWMFPVFTVGLFSSGTESGTDNSFLKNCNTNSAVAASIFPGTYNSSKLQVESFENDKPYFRGDHKEYAALEKYYGKPVHIAIQVQKQRFRIWINETKAFDLPKAVPAGKILNQLFFKIGSTNYPEEQYGMYISNIKVAKGVEDTRHRLVEEGKFTTTAILFDVNTATLKPESFGVIKEIASVLKEHGDIKISITGHTDSDGSDAANLTLSQKRAAAVKDALAKEFGIDAARIETDGKGETKPVADNKTKEGKAANRRVEFIKL